MAKALNRKETGHPLSKTLWQMGSALVSGIKPLIHQLRDGLDAKLGQYVGRVEKRLLFLALRGFIVLLGVAFIGFGFFFVLMDNGGVSRGTSCLCCGLFALVISFFRVQIIEEKGSSKWKK